MKDNDFQKPESIKISYNQEKIKEIVDELFRNSQCIDKKKKILDFLSNIEEKINMPLAQNLWVFLSTPCKTYRLSAAS